MKRTDNNTPRKKFAAFDILKPKNIIMDAIANKLEGSGVVKIILTFSVENDDYKILVTDKDDKLMKLNVTEDEVTTIKKVFIKRIVNAWNLKYDEEVAEVVVQIDVLKRSMDLYIKNLIGTLLKFDY